jgi:hypothetical protein
MVVAGLLLAAGACRSGEGAAPPRTAVSPSTSTPASAPTIPSGPTGPASVGPDIVTLLVNNVRLVNSEESDNGFRILVDSAASDVSVLLTGIPSPNRTIFVCPATELDRRAPTRECATPETGEPARVPHSATHKGVEVVQVGVTGTGPAAGTTAVSAIAVTYTPTSREVRLRLPPLRAGTAGEAASFRLSPAGSGAGEYRATATWMVGGAPGTAEIALVAGSRVAAQSNGGPGVALTGTLPPPAEATLRVKNTGSTTLTALTITALFP